MSFRHFSTRTLNLLLAVLATTIFLSVAATAQSPVTWELRMKEGSQSRLEKESVNRFELIAEIEKGWHLYSTDQPAGGPIPTTISVGAESQVELIGPITSGKPIKKFDPNFGIDTTYFDDSAVFKFSLRAKSEIASDDATVRVRYQVCDDRVCLPPKTVTVGRSGVIAPAPQQNQEIVRFGAEKTEGIWGFVILAASLGLLSLLTPCVFPMIPITVSYFTRHAKAERVHSIKLAFVYALGIVLTFTMLGMLLAVAVGASGLNLFAANPWVNIIIALIFITFALGLFGFFDLSLPSSVVNKLDALTRAKEGKGGGYVGAILMGLTFTVTSFTCTSPFVGTILVSAAQGEWQKPLVGMLTFSTVFAVPFFILALAPNLLGRLPRSGAWMSSIKVAMGFLELAAAIKFISNVDLVWGLGIFSRTIVLVIWIGIAAALAAYLIGLFKFPHEAERARLSIVRIIATLSVVVAAGYLILGISGRRLGELESFLPPDLALAEKNAGKGELEWLKDDLDGALEEARLSGKRVFIDFTGYTCTNCRWMEANMFIRPEIRAELDGFVRVKLFTDGIGEVYERQQLFQEQTFQTVALPFYAVLDQSGRPVSTFPGLTRDADEFAEFLRQSKSK